MKKLHTKARRLRSLSSLTKALRVSFITTPPSVSSSPQHVKEGDNEKWKDRGNNIEMHLTLGSSTA